jgi:uncharacterized repeat protein (TIGR03803 family)
LCGSALLIFSLATALHAQIYSVVYNFGDVDLDAAGPQYSGIIAQGRDGNLYTTTPFGGTNGYGTVVKITPSGQETVLYNFDITTDSNEGSPFSGLTLGTDGNLYGTTLGYHETDGGTVFKITPAGTMTFLHTFSSAEGRNSFAPPIQAADGNFYGTTAYGGTNGRGTVYKMTPSGQVTTLYSFDYTNGMYPYAPLIQGTDGNLYGQAWEGGASGAGTVFRLSLQGKITTLHSFDYYSGSYPVTPLVQGSDGNLYGVTGQGGDSDLGVVFKVTTKGKFTLLHSLSGADGQYPGGGLVQGTDGNLYGTAYGEPGTIFRITPRGKFSVIHNFDTTTGFHPEVTLLQHTTGMLYGDTFNGGSHSYGTIYSLDAALPPYAALVTSASKVGKSIGILGQGFTGALLVSFNGTPAQFTVVSDTYLTAVVPDGATTGQVSVQMPTGDLPSKQIFRVMPTIKSFSPSSGAVGTPVIITGVSLTQTSRVTFGGIAATSFTVDNDKQVTATVPAGAKSGKIAIATAGGTATSSGTFTVTQ